jgi:hypothetical protein
MARPAKFSLELDRRSLADDFSSGNANTAETMTMQILLDRWVGTRRTATRE